MLLEIISSLFSYLTIIIKKIVNNVNQIISFQIYSIKDVCFVLSFLIYLIQFQKRKKTRAAHTHTKFIHPFVFNQATSIVFVVKGNERLVSSTKNNHKEEN